MQTRNPSHSDEHVGVQVDILPSESIRYSHESRSNILNDRIYFYPQPLQ